MQCFALLLERFDVSRYNVDAIVSFLVRKGQCVDWAISRSLSLDNQAVCAQFEADICLKTVGSQHLPATRHVKYRHVILRNNIHKTRHISLIIQTSSKTCARTLVY